MEILGHKITRNIQKIQSVFENYFHRNNSNNKIRSKKEHQDLLIKKFKEYFFDLSPNVLTNISLDESKLKSMALNLDFSLNIYQQLIFEMNRSYLLNQVKEIQIRLSTEKNFINFECEFMIHCQEVNEIHTWKTIFQLFVIKNILKEFRLKNNEVIQNTKYYLKNKKQFHTIQIKYAAQDEKTLKNRPHIDHLREIIELFQFETDQDLSSRKPL